MMRNILCCVLAVGLAGLAYSASPTTPAKKSTAKKAVAKKTSSKTTVHKAGTTTSARKTGKKGAPVQRTTWRNRQLAPSPERYKEIQVALVAKGYLKPEDTGAGWNQTSMDALKRFQGEQNLEATGKINSLSLIALGLGPKHDTVPPKQADPGSIQ